MKTRQISQVFPGLRTTEGGGVSIRRAFPTREIEDLDPFLLLDEMGPVDVAPGEAQGFPDHPHRGFETVTYLLSGQMEHQDSFGRHGLLNPGDVQWMTAGAGLVHSEMPGPDLIREGGRLHGFQLWVNLPKRVKMAEPHYQELSAARIPVGADESGLVTARVIAGAALGQKAIVATNTPIVYLHFTLAPGARHVQPMPSNWSAFAYVFEGAADFGEGHEPVGEGNIAVFADDGDAISITNPGPGKLQLLLAGGEPLHEPVARWGPFVMNTKTELQKAFEDYRGGRMGSIAVRG